MCMVVALLAVRETSREGAIEAAATAAGGWWQLATRSAVIVVGTGCDSRP